MSEINQIYNVVCVSKYGNNRSEFHCPMTGTAEIVRNTYIAHGIEVSSTKVRFDGREHHLMSIGAGLDGAALTLMIEKDDYPFTRWDLYTDTPAKEGVSPEDIRRKARETTRRTY